MIDKEILINNGGNVVREEKAQPHDGADGSESNDDRDDDDTDDDDQELDPMSFLPLASLCQPRALYSSIYALLGVTGAFHRKHNRGETANLNKTRQS